MRLNVAGGGVAAAGLAGGWKSRFRTVLPVVGALAGAAAFGALDHRPDGHAPAFLAAVSDMSAPWLLVPFVAGAVQPRRGLVRLIGLAAALLAVTAYVVTTGDLVDVGPPLASGTSAPPSTPRMNYVLANAPWLLGGVIGGPVCSLLGYRWRVTRSWPLALAATAPVTLEPAMRWIASRAAIQFWWAYPPAFYAETLTGLALTGAAVVIARRGGVVRAGQEPAGSPGRERSLSDAAWRAAGVAFAAGVVVAFLAPSVTAPVVNTMATPNALAITRDGTTLYVADTIYTSVVTPIDTATLRVGQPIRTGQISGQLVVTPDARILFGVAGDPNSSSGTGFWVERVNLRTHARTPIRVPGGADKMALSGDGKTLYVSTYDNSIVPVSVATGRAQHPFRLPLVRDRNASPDYLALSPDGGTLYADLSSSTDPNTTATDDEIVGVDTVTGAAKPWIYHDHDLRAMALAPNGRTLYLIGNADYNDGGEMAQGEHHLTAVNTATGAPAVKPLPLRAGPLALAVTPDGRDLAIAYQNSIALMPLAPLSGNQAGRAAPTGQSVSLSGWLDPGENFDLAFSPGGSTLYVLTSDGTEVIRVK